jgi:hypothetical protein
MKIPKNETPNVFNGKMPIVHRVETKIKLNIMQEQIVKIKFKNIECKGCIIDRRIDKYKIQFEFKNQIKQDWFTHKEFKRVW